jgi:hypothetical protein
MFIAPFGEARGMREFRENEAFPCRRTIVAVKGPYIIFKI